MLSSTVSHSPSLSPYRLEAQSARVRDAPGRDQELLGHDRAVVVELQADASVVSPFDGDRGDVEVHRHAERAQRLLDRLAGERLVVLQEPAPRDEVDLDTEAGVRRRHLHRHDSAAEDRERRGDLLDARRIPARPRAALAEAGDVGQEGRGSRRDDDGMPRGQHGDRPVLGRHGDLPGCGDDAVPAREVDPRRAEPLRLAAVVPVVRDAVPPPQDGAHVERARHCFPCAADMLCRRAAERCSAAAPSTACTPSRSIRRPRARPRR